MAFRVDLLDEEGLGGISGKSATRLCALAFSEMGHDPAGLGEVSVVLVGAEEMRGLNSRFRDRDYATDVLSFTMDGPGGEMVGEIVICPEAAEMKLDELVVHGTLHLCGLDHGDDFEASEMSGIQRRVMEEALEAG